MTSLSTIETILRRPYHRIIVPDEDSGEFGASVQEFEGCFAVGESAAVAYVNLEKAARAWLEGMIEGGLSIPEPIEEPEYSGKVALRLPKSVHRRAVEQARQDGVSLNTFLVAAIVEKVAITAPTAIRVGV